MLPWEATSYEGVTLLAAMAVGLPGHMLWEINTARENRDLHCISPALLNAPPPPQLWVLWGFWLCAPHASGKGGGAQVQPTSCGNRLFLQVMHAVNRQAGCAGVAC